MNYSRRHTLAVLTMTIVSAVLGSANLAHANNELDIGRELGRHTNRFGFQHVYVLVEPNLSSDTIVAIAREWHVREPGSWFWFLDDDAKAQQLLEALPRVEKGDLDGYPRDWVAKHTVANVAMLLIPGGAKKMAVMPGSARMGDPLAVLED